VSTSGAASTASEGRKKATNAVRFKDSPLAKA
jgi:hypothetical protein